MMLALRIRREFNNARHPENPELISGLFSPASWRGRVVRAVRSFSIGGEISSSFVLSKYT